MTYNENICSTSFSSDTGYQKPPTHTRWKPGQSGNPRGRPKKKSDDIARLLLNELQQHIFIEENGKRTKVTKREVLVKQILKKALMGDNKCLDFVLQVEKIHASLPVEAESIPELSERMVSPVWKRFLETQRGAKARKILT